MGRTQDLLAIIRSKPDHQVVMALDELLPRWIPVSERLPSREQVVLAYTPGDTYCGRNVYEALFVSMNQWCTDRGDEEFVTHWMPLPEPPNCSM